ncbi:MAG TPA: flagellar basal body rod protein FlgC [Clostridiales bacterium]|nr:flagellar basal body rod protein FlgC [Clostridiales bacterium]
MGFLSGMDISASGLNAQRLRMDVISENIANIDTTRTEDGTPYTRKYVVLEERGSNFSDIMRSKTDEVQGGVRVAEIGLDTTDYDLVYDPAHPDANEEGYVQMPNVDLSQEIVNMISAYRSYEANVTAFNAYKDMAVKSLEIGS